MNRYVENIELYLKRLQLLKEVELIENKLRSNININETSSFYGIDEESEEEAVKVLEKHNEITLKMNDSKKCNFHYKDVDVEINKNDIRLGVNTLLLKIGDEMLNDKNKVK